MIVQHNMVIAIAVHYRSSGIAARTIQGRIDGDMFSVMAIDEDQSLDRIRNGLKKLNQQLINE